MRGALPEWLAGTLIRNGPGQFEVGNRPLRHWFDGLAQLHQLRGRIGRGSQKSHCVLVAPGRLTDEGRARLETMVRTNNGFEIAETDLQLRGPGEFFGTRQSGELGFHVANPLRDRSMLELARKEAFALTGDPAQKETLQGILRRLPGEWQRRYHLAHVG